MSEAELLAVLAPNEPYLIASRSGRILQAAPAFVSMTGTDPTGRNLNDFLDDNAVSQLILQVNGDDVYLFDCEIFGCFCSCGAQLSAPGRMVMVFRLLEDRRGQSENLELIRYMSRRINEGIGDLNLALRMLKSSPEDAHAEGLLNKSILNLIRVSRNAASKADYADGGVALQPQVADLTETLNSVCRRAAAMAAPYYDVTAECPDEKIECIHDVTAVQRAILDLIHHALSHSPLSHPRVHLKFTREADHIHLHLHAAGSAASTYQPTLGPDGKPLYGDALELDVASLLLRSQGGNLVSSFTNDGGWTCRATLPICPDDGRKLSNLTIDWYGGRDMVAVELSGLLPAEAYHAGING